MLGRTARIVRAAAPSRNGITHLVRGTRGVVDAHAAVVRALLESSWTARIALAQASRKRRVVRVIGRTAFRLRADTVFGERIELEIDRTAGVGGARAEILLDVELVSIGTAGVGGAIAGVARVVETVTARTAFLCAADAAVLVGEPFVISRTTFFGPAHAQLALGRIKIPCRTARIVSADAKTFFAVVPCGTAFVARACTASIGGRVAIWTLPEQGRARTARGQCESGEEEEMGAHERHSLEKAYSILTVAPGGGMYPPRKTTLLVSAWY
jgi:hypothetical protein